MNRHPTFLGLLGILPNQLRSLLKESGHEHREEVLLDLNKTLFFAGFRVWSKRQHLATRYWIEIGQRLKAGIKKRKKRKKENSDLKISESNCQNPFHFLRRQNNLSKQRPTKCPCRNIVIQTTYRNQPITAFVSRDSKHVLEFADIKHVRKAETKSSKQNRLIITRSDVIRKEHDRGRKRSYKQLTLNVETEKKRRIY
jgi:hypothetical protein